MKRIKMDKDESIFGKAKRKIRGFFYDISVRLHRSRAPKPPRGRAKRNRGALIFCICMLAYPLVQWVIFYLYANLNSIFLAFQRYDVNTGQQVFLTGPNVFNNFKNVLYDLIRGESLGKYFLNGAILHLASVVIAYPISQFFAFIIYKKCPLSGAFKTILYLPSILSSMVIAMFFKYFVERALPAYLGAFGIKNIPLLLNTESTAFGTIMFYTLFFAMPGAIVINTGTMSRVPVDLIEYGKLEGLSMWKEFVYLTIPLMYPLIEVQLLGVFVGFFTYSGPLYALYAESAPASVQTFGYYMFTRIVGRNASDAYYGYTAASNLMIGIASVPIVYGTKFLLDKIDPEVEF